MESSEEKSTKIFITLIFFAVLSTKERVEGIFGIEEIGKIEIQEEINK